MIARWLPGLLLLASAARAQEPAQEPVTTLKLQARIVAMAAVVRDKAGRPVGGLGKEDFVLKEDGKPQEVRYFSQGDAQPLTLALMVDTSGSQRMYLADETAASMVFFRAMLVQPKDRAALVQFDNNVLELQGMTHDVDNLQRSLDYLSTPHNSALPHGAGGTLLYDAICSEAPRLEKEQGRKAMVLLTDGDDHGSRQSLADAAHAAQKADVVVYAVFYSADSGTSRSGMLFSSGARGVLEKLAEDSGGQVFDVGRKTSLRDIFARIEEDMRLEYLLGFRPGEGKPGKYHKLELKTKDGKLSVDTRKGYYGAD